MFQEINEKQTASTALLVDNLVPDSDEELKSGEMDDLILDLNNDEPQQGLSGNTGYVTSSRVTALTSLSPLQLASTTLGILHSLASPVIHISVPRSVVFQQGLVLMPATS